MRRILVVDDEPDIVRVVVTIMKDCGHEVAIARDGETALEMARAQPPDAIILDLLLPRLDGYEVCRQLKADERTRHIPIILMTAAYVSLDEARQVAELGADEYVVKPFMREVLVRNVERCLPHARNQT